MVKRRQQDVGLRGRDYEATRHPDLVLSTRYILHETRHPIVTSCRSPTPTLNTYTTGNPFLGAKLLGISIGRGFGALKGST